MPRDISPGSGKRRQIKLAVFCAAVVIISAMFTTDTIRVKYYDVPPVFCIASGPLSDGVSMDYYGIGYKIWKDTDPFEGVTDYHITLWILPRTVSF